MSKWLYLAGAMGLILGMQSAVSFAGLDLNVGKSAEIRLSESAWIGDAWLERGLYRVRCDHKSDKSHEMVFTRLAEPNPYYTRAPRATEQAVRLQCHVHPVYLKNKQTAVHMGKRNGEPAVTKIVIRGENVEHRF